MDSARYIPESFQLMFDVSKHKGRKPVAVGMAYGLFGAVIIGFLVYNFAPFTIPLLPNCFDRIVYTLRCNAFSLLMLMVGIMVVENVRFYTNSVDPDTKKDMPVIEKHLDYVRDTMEQLVLHLLGSLILVSYIQPATVKIIPTLCVLFVIGRWNFWRGYDDPTAKSFGFCLSFYPSVTVITYNVYLCLVYGLSYGFDVPSQ